MLAAVEAASPALSGQTSGNGSKPGLPRTRDGRPDFQGVWDFRTLTPMERPRELAAKSVLTAEEAADFERRHGRNNDDRHGPDWSSERPLGTINGAETTRDLARAYNDFWLDYATLKVVEDRRTSLIVDPPNGTIPPLTVEATQRAAARAARLARPAVGPEDRSLAERCILGFNSGPPIWPGVGAYNNNVQIFQTPHHVVLLNEMVHNARMIPLDGQPQLPKTIRQWVGSSRGRWEGDMLVVETTNFRGETTVPDSSANLQLTERFRLADGDTLIYEFTMNDPTTWTRPWIARIPMKRSRDRVYEYACHEGNYGMTNLLSAARAVEQAERRR
jgi:hypothetical protein